MLDQLDLALRKFKEIAPDPSVTMTDAQADRLQEWLKSDVGEITSSLLTQPGFQRRALWPLEMLTGRSVCDEHAAVSAVDTSLVRYAQCLAEFARTPAIWEQLHRLGPYLEEISPGDDLTLPEGLQFVEFLATRPWKDLVSPADYFGSVSHFNYRDGDVDQRAEFTPFMKPHLRPPGDFVSRCMEIRVETWCSALHRFWVRCNTARQRAGLEGGTDWDSTNAVGVELSEGFESLRILCFQGADARLRDACIALLQVYVAFHPRADLEWLGKVAGYSVNASGIPHSVTSQHQWEVPERIAGALLEIKDLVRKPQNPEDVIKEKMRKYRLVLVEESRQGFLDGQSISRDKDTNWQINDGPWELLWTSADRAQVRRLVDRLCLSNLKDPGSQEPPSNQAIRDRRADLKKLIIPELDQLIVKAGDGSYRLDLEPDKICRLGFETEERLVELPPQPPRSESGETFANFLNLASNQDETS